MRNLAYWPSVKPLSKNDKFAKNRDFIKNLHHIDQIWEELKFKCGDTLAVCDLRAVSYTHLTLPTTAYV